MRTSKISEDNGPLATLRSLAKGILDQKTVPNLSQLSEVIALERLVCDILTSVKCLRNQFAPANCLPAEILCMIFTLACDSSNEPSSRAQKALNCSHVCQRWRDVAISYPSLWSEIFITYGQTIDPILSIQRSNPHPLNITIQLSGLRHPLFGSKPNLPQLSDHRERIQSMDLILDVLSQEEALGMVTFPAPTLESLRCEFIHPSSSTFNVPPFQGWTPKLKELELVNFAITEMKSFKNLTSIKLLKHRYPSINMEITQLLDVLRRCPLLETLHIHGHPCLPFERNEKAIRLRALRKVSLSETHARHILSHISAPGLQNLVVEHPRYNAPQAPLPFDKSQFQLSETLHTLIISTKTQDSQNGEDHNGDGPGTMRLILNFENGTDLDAEVFTATLEYLTQVPLPKLTRLSLDCICPANREDMLRGFLSSVPTLRFLRIMPCRSVAPLVHLRADPRSCPLLETLTVLTPMRTSKESMTEAVNSVRGFISSRAAAGHHVLIEHKTSTAAMSQEWTRLCAKHGFDQQLGRGEWVAEISVPR